MSASVVAASAVGIVKSNASEPMEKSIKDRKNQKGENQGFRYYQENL